MSGPGYRPLPSAALADTLPAWRVTLVEAAAARAEAIDPWLAEALAAVTGRRLISPDRSSLVDLLDSLEEHDTVFRFAVPLVEPWD